MIAVAIDGPAGAGKSTIAKILAKKVNFIYIDTGALYRTITLSVLRNKISVDDIESIGGILKNLKISLKFINGEQRVFIDNEDVSDFIRTEEISLNTSKIASIPIVREYLLNFQRDFAQKNNVIMDGRDIGTVVLPNAQLKIFLTASPEIRAERRFNQLAESGQNEKYEDILQKVKQRDYEDSHRKIAPLVPAKDAVILDTSNDTLEQSVERLAELIKKLL